MRSGRGIRLKRIKIVQRKNGRAIYYRHPSGRFIRLPNLPENHPEFIAAYAKAEDATPPRIRRTAEGSLSHIAEAYKASAGWKALAPATRYSRARILDKILDKGGTVPVTKIQPKHIANDLADLEPHAARNRLKVWRGMMKFAKGRGLVEIDPAKPVEPPAAPIIGRHTWTDAEIEQYRDAHQSGTQARMALELYLWSAARRADGLLLGRQHIRDGMLRYTQGKTGAYVEIPVLDDFAAEMAQLPPGQMLFLETARGTPHSAKAFGAWFSNRCREAGLHGRCVLHGLRKARARIMAENGATPHMIGAWTGHKTLAEISHYSEKADRAKLAKEAAKLEQKSTPFQKGRKA